MGGIRIVMTVAVRMIAIHITRGTLSYVRSITVGILRRIRDVWFAVRKKVIKNETEGE